MSEPIHIRLAQDRDLDEVGQITLDAYVSAGFLTPDDDYASHLLDAAARAREAELWVAELEGAVVGSVTFCPPGSEHREVAADDEGEFRMLAVSPRAQRRGVADALVRTCLDRCRDLGLDRVAICSMREMVAAHTLYLRMGFERDESLDWSPVEDVDLWGFRASLR